MILGRGMAQTDEAIIAEYQQFVLGNEDLHDVKVRRRLQGAAGIMCGRMGKAMREWSDEEIIALYEGQPQATRSAYNCFLAFLLFRGYRRASISLLTTLQFHLTRQWKCAFVPYRKRIEATNQKLGYSQIATQVGNLLLWLLTFSGKTLEELTRADFEAFQQAHEQWYRQARRRIAYSTVRFFFDFLMNEVPDTLLARN